MVKVISTQGLTAIRRDAREIYGWQPPTDELQTVVDDKRKEKQRVRMQKYRADLKKKGGKSG